MSDLTGVELIAAERERQVAEKGYTEKHDVDEHEGGDLLHAAISYAICASQREPLCGWSQAQVEDLVLSQWWPWDERELKRGPGAIGELVKAGALIAAEIDRLQRDGDDERSAG